MPCVLPVVGLKLLSFVQQSNDSRRRVLLLNVAYSAGLMSVMLVLATFAVFAGLGWGEQFSRYGSFSRVTRSRGHRFRFLGSALAWAIVQPAYLTYTTSPRRARHGQPYLLVGLFPGWSGSAEAGH